MMFDIDNMYCGAIRRGDIFLHTENGKEEAVVVLQDDVLSAGLPTVVCAKIQPKRKTDQVHVNEVLLLKDASGLGRDGICMLHKICTVDRRYLQAKKGEVPTRILVELFAAVDATFGRFRDI